MTTSTNALAQAEAFEILESEGRSLAVNFENDRLTEIRQAQSSGVSVRAVRDGKIGFSYSSKAGETDAVAAAALRLAPFGKPYNFRFAGPATANGTREVDERCGKLDADRLVELCGKVKDVIKSVDPEAMAECSVGGSVGRTRIETSQGQACEERSSSFNWFAMAKIAEEGNFLYTYRSGSGNRVVDDARILQDARDAAEEFRIARKTAPIKAGTYPVLFSPTALSDFLMPIAVSINGQNIARKISRWVDSMGQSLFDERITLVDDPFVAEGPGSSLYDGEGVPTRRRPIIERGVLKGFLHTLSTAQQSGHEPTGNAARGVSTLPTPGLHNLVMAAGSDDLDELFKRAEGGLCISQMLGTFTSNFLAGQVSGNISLGYLVKEGARVGRVKNCALNVNAFDLFKSRVLGISRVREWTGNELLPWVLVDAVPVSAR